MKKMLLAMVATVVLVLGYSPSAQADSFLSITVGATTISCNNSTTAGVTACGTAGFTTSLASNVITIAGVSIGGYSISSIVLVGNQPGTPAQANAIDTKTAITNNSGASPLVVQFASNNYSLPVGSPLTLSASQAGTFTVGKVGDTESFTGFGNAANTLAVTGVADVTPNCALSVVAPPVNSCSTVGPTTPFARSGNFALAGMQQVNIAQGSTASFTATVAATPPATPPVPEPSSVLLLGTGLIMLAGGRKLRRK
jgi:hypothetical protein